MMLRASIVAFALALGATPAHAVTSRNELLFQVNAALLAHDRAAFVRCFNFAEADEATRASFVKIVNQIFSWPTHYVFATDRSGTDNPPIRQGGHTYRLNGDWKFQVHIFLSEKTSKGFVFPAGLANGQCLILVAVPEKPQ